MAAQYPDIRVDQYPHRHPDARTSCSVRRCFDVVVGSNLFGDILSDLGPAVCGTIGIAPSANINPERDVSVAVRAGARLGAGHRRQGHRQSDRPDLVGRADARLLGYRDAARRSSRRSSACSPIRTRRAPADIGGRATTVEAGKAIAARCYDRRIQHRVARPHHGADASRRTRTEV